jgi:tetratricopeptide (TPR) repeat protein
VREIARDLGVATVLEGSLRRTGDLVRVIVRLVDAHTGFHIWSQSYDRHADGLLGLRAELATEVVQALTPSRQGSALGVGSLVRPTASPQAYRLFLSANALVGASDANMRAAIALYDEAMALDPTFARALAARAAARLVLVSHGSVRLRELREAERDARAALSIDPDIASAHVSLAHVLRLRGEWLLAEDAHQMALAKAGNDPMVLTGHQAMLSLTGHLRAALDEAETAYRLAPLALPTTMWRALAYSFVGRDEAALRDAAIGRSLGAPADAGGFGFILARAAERQGRYADAGAHLTPLLPAAARAAGAAAITLAYEAAVNPAKRLEAVTALRHLASTVAFGDLDERRWRLLLWLNTIAGDLDEAYAVGNRALDEAARSGLIGASWAASGFRRCCRSARIRAFRRSWSGSICWSIGRSMGRRTVAYWITARSRATETLRGYQRRSSTASHARASFQSRMTVCGETPRVSAVSSTVNPPK